MKLKQKLASSMKKGWTMMELIFVIVVMGLGIAAVVQIGTNAMQDSEIDSAIGKSTQTIVGGLPKYKFEYQGSNGGYDAFKSDTFKTFVRPLTPDATTGATYMYPSGYSNIKYIFGPGDTSATHTTAFVCMDASSKYDASTTSGANTLLAAQQKFVSNIQKLSNSMKFKQFATLAAAGTDGTAQDTSGWDSTSTFSFAQPAAAANKVICAGDIK